MSDPVPVDEVVLSQPPEFSFMVSAGSRWLDEKEVMRKLQVMTLEARQLNATVKRMQVQWNELLAQRNNLQIEMGAWRERALRAERIDYYQTAAERSIDL